MNERLGNPQSEKTAMTTESATNLGRNSEGQRQEPEPVHPTPYRFLSIDQCSVHRFWAVCVGNWNGGKRLTPSKCCGSWKTVTQWKLSADDLREMANELEGVAVAVDRELAVDFRSFLPEEVAPAGAPQRGELTRDEALHLLADMEQIDRVDDIPGGWVFETWQSAVAKLRRLIAESPEERA